MRKTTHFGPQAAVEERLALATVRTCPLRRLAPKASRASGGHRPKPAKGFVGLLLGLAGPPSFEPLAAPAARGCEKYHVPASRRDKCPPLVGEFPGKSSTPAYSRQLLPGLRAALQDAYARDSLRPQEQRRTGARSLVRSTTEKDDLAVPRDFSTPGSEFVRRQAYGSGDARRIVLQPAAQVENVQILTGVELFL